MSCRRLVIPAFVVAGLAGCATTSDQGTLAELQTVEADVGEIYLEDRKISKQCHGNIL